MGLAHRINHIGSMMTLFFTDQDVTDYASAKTSDTVRYATFFKAALDLGVSFAPSQFEAAFVSTAHSDADLMQTARIVRAALAASGG